MLTRPRLGSPPKLAFLLATWLLAIPAMAEIREPTPGSGKGYLPVEATEIPQSDREMAGLFLPSISNSGLKVADGEGGRKLVTITSERILNGRAVRKFNESLLSRGVSIYGAAYFGDFSWDRTVIDAAVTATRKVEGEADTIEVSDGIARDPKTDQPLMPMTVSIHEMYIPLREDFGKTWKKMRLIPEAEPAAPEPMTGRYPGSRIRLVRQNGPDKRDVVYAVKGELGDVEQFFDERLRERHRTVIVAGDPSDSPSPAEVFGIKTSAQVIVLSGYSYASGTRKLSVTEVTLKRAKDPNLAPYVEIEVVEN